MESVYFVGPARMSEGTFLYLQHHQGSHHEAEVPILQRSTNFMPHVEKGLHQQGEGYIASGRIGDRIQISSVAVLCSFHDAP